MAVLAETPNLRPHFRCVNALLRWKEGQPLQPTAGAVSSSTQEDVPMLSQHRFTCHACDFEPGGPWKRWPFWLKRQI